MLSSPEPQVISSPENITDKGWRHAVARPSLPEIYRSLPIPQSAGFFRKLLAFAGPGYLVAVGYMDPGNWATDLAGGSKYNYSLLSVILLSNLMAILLQTLAIKLGVVTGRDLAAACRDHFSRPVSFIFWMGRDCYCRLRPGRSNRLCHRAESAVSHSADLGCVHHLS